MPILRSWILAIVSVAVYAVHTGLLFCSVYGMHACVHQRTIRKMEMYKCVHAGGAGTWDVRIILCNSPPIWFFGLRENAASFVWKCCQQFYFQSSENPLYVPYKSQGPANLNHIDRYAVQQKIAVISNGFSFSTVSYKWLYILFRIWQF